MLDLLFTATFMASLVLSAPTAAPLGNKVTLSTGTILGNPRDANGVLNFKGIPYAQPPTGNLRWSAPQPAVNHAGVLITTAFGASCYAATTAEQPYFTAPSEDCLFVNVWTAAQQASEKRPVMFWIHGGGFEFGGSAVPSYDGSNLAGEGVVVVSLNYRLGVFGFLALTELDFEGPTNSGNFGLQDQLLALRWIKANIAAFGGDPDNVTVFGQSAGAHSVGLLMSSSLSAGLFQKAIMESGAFWDSNAGPLRSYVDARQQGAAFEQAVGVNTVAQLRAMPAAQINGDAMWNPNTDPKLTAFAPSIDNYVIRSPPGQVFQNGQQQKVPLLAGFNSDEGLIFVPYGLSTTSTKAYEDGLKAYFTYQESTALAIFPDSSPAVLAASSIALTGDLVISEQTYTALNLQHSTAGLPAGSVWAYYFNYASAYSPVALHTAEIPFVFGNLGPNPIFGPNEGAPTSQDRSFSMVLMSYWTNFAKTGNPNGVGVPAWPAYCGNGQDIIQLGDQVEATNYAVSGLNFIASFRTDGVLPEVWASINVSTIN